MIVCSRYLEFSVSNISQFIRNIVKTPPIENKARSWVKQKLSKLLRPLIRDLTLNIGQTASLH